VVGVEWMEELVEAEISEEGVVPWTVEAGVVVAADSVEDSAGVTAVTPHWPAFKKYRAPHTNCPLLTPQNVNFRAALVSTSETSSLG